MDYRVHYTVLRRTSLFRSMSDADLDVLMGCFSPHIRRYRRGELLLMAGYETRELGIVLEGEITAAKPMPDGSAVVMTHMGPGGVFADVLAGGRSKSPVTVAAAQPCRVLYLPCEALLRPCQVELYSDSKYLGPCTAPICSCCTTGWTPSAANILHWTGGWNCCAAKACGDASACGCWSSGNRRGRTPSPRR